MRRPAARDSLKPSGFNPPRLGGAFPQRENSRFPDPFPASISICNSFIVDRIIVHIDMDAFFAAVEERERPRIRGLPIVVGADPKGGVGRGVVSTANYKAREYGIRSAQPISIAWRLSEEAARQGKPRAVFLEPNFRLYSAVSREIMEYLRTKADAFEPASIDEAYLQISSLTVRHSERKRRISKDSSGFSPQNDLWNEAGEIAKEIKRYILKNQKLTCSIGIGPNKLIAKIAAGRQKPDGLTIVKPDEVQNFLDPLSVREIPGIGPKSEETLAKIGIRTIQQLRQLERERLGELFGKPRRTINISKMKSGSRPLRASGWGLDMWRKAQGIDESPVQEEYGTKSIGEQETYEKDTLNSNFLIGRLKELSQSVFKTIEKEEFSFKTVSIIVRFHDFETKTRAHTLDKPVQDGKILEAEALQLFLPFLDTRENPKKKMIRLLGVRVEKLERYQNGRKPVI